MLVELLRPAGPELARRWLAALLLAPPEERQGIVEAVEARMTSTYGADADAPFRAHSGPVQREGYTEETITDYSVARDAAGPSRAARSRA